MYDSDERERVVSFTTFFTTRFICLQNWQKDTVTMDREYHVKGIRPLIFTFQLVSHGLLQLDTDSWSRHAHARSEGREGG